ncbi:MAG: hypothetical protein WDZ62_00470 [Candidatus Pacearchaeota archaeon]
MNLKSFIIAVAIMILTISAVVYGIYSFYSPPDYGELCFNIRSPVPDIGDANEEVCPAVCVEMYELDIENEDCFLNDCGSGCGPDGKTTFETLEQCKIALSGENCWDVYEDEREKYSRNIFLLAVPLGILIIALGLVIFGLETVGSGLMAGGVGVIFWSVGGFWKFADNWLKFIISIIGLITLIWLAYWFEKRFGKKKKKRKVRKRG